MKKRKPTKDEQLRLDWLDHNRRQTNPKLRMSFDEYSKWVFGNSRQRIKAIEKCPTYTTPAWAPDNKSVKSKITKTSHQAGRNTVVERVRRGIICGSDAQEILAKTQRIGLLTSKGGYGYISPETDPKTLGKKTQEL